MTPSEFQLKYKNHNFDLMFDGKNSIESMAK